MYSPKAHYIDTVVPDNNNPPSLEGAYYMKIGGMCNIKH